MAAVRLGDVGQLLFDLAEVIVAYPGDFLGTWFVTKHLDRHPVLVIDFFESLDDWQEVEISHAGAQ